MGSEQRPQAPGLTWAGGQGLLGGIWPAHLHGVLTRSWYNRMPPDSRGRSGSGGVVEVGEGFPVAVNSSTEDAGTGWEYFGFVLKMWSHVAIPGWPYTPKESSFSDC